MPSENATAATQRARPAYVRWYGKQRWRNLARYQLQEHPLCAKCLSIGRVTPASVADHVERHNGNEYAFWTGALQSLCVPCHNRTKQREEVRGYSSDIDADGWPTDPMHPSNAKKPKR
jgi:5-methylcytosine-specific restriction enzyme A